tara:strand:- start:150 stop:1388 length:1239 start_codon:yes stop_codon:yes gene_type:complete
LLISLYFYLKFIHTKKIYYSFLFGFFILFALLAKIQIIFLLFIFLILLPFLINHFDAKFDAKLVYGEFYYKLNFFIIIIFIFFFFFYQTVLGIIYLLGSYDQRFFLTNNLDFYLFFGFIFFYFIFVKFLSKKKLVEISQIVISISSIIIGITLCVFFIFILDFLNIIPFHKAIILRVMNPFEYMNLYTQKTLIPLENILISIKQIFLGAIGLRELAFDFNSLYNPKILGVEVKAFFRILYILLILFLILISLRKLNNNNLNSLIIILLGGIVIHSLMFNIRDTHSYNIYIFPLYIILFSLILNQFNKSYIIKFYSILALFFLFENIALSNIHKNAFKREPRVFAICSAENWKNSENYIQNFNNSSHVSAVEKSMMDFWLTSYFYGFYKNKKLFTEFCDQLKNSKEEKVKFYF